MAKRDQDVHFLASKEEVERIHEKMDELGIRSMGAYLRKMALDGYCIRLDLQDVKALVSLLRICSNNLNTVSVEAHDSTENMQEKHQGNQICDDENLGRTFEAERRAVF